MDSGLVLPVIILLGIFCQWLAWRIRIPSILPLLLVGIIIGPILQIYQPRDYLGETILQQFISFSVAIILFEGALTLKFREIQTRIYAVRNLVTIGSLITVIATGIFTHYILDLSWAISFLFGAFVSVTGPTVITPLLRNTNANVRISSILKWEGILIDPIGALMAVLLLNFIIYSQYKGLSGINEILLQFFMVLVSSIGIGVVSGAIVYWILRKYLVPDYLRDIAILGVLLGTFGLSNFLYQDSGLFAVTVMGIILANVRLKQVREIWHFKEKLSTLLVSLLFIVLAADVSVETLKLLDWRAALIVAILMLVVRPLSVFVSSTIHPDTVEPLTTKEKLFLSWIAPRGIVAASISSLFALELSHYGNDEGLILAPLTFLVIFATVSIQGLTAKKVAVALGVAELEPQGFLILSANKFSRMLAKVLKREGFVVKMVDNNWSHVRAARLLNLDVYYGNILSEEIENEADLSGIGRLMALTSNQEANTLACIDYRNHFGSSEVYQLSTKDDRKVMNDPHSQRQTGRILFGEDINLNLINDFIYEGATVRKVAITEQYSYIDFLTQHEQNAIPLLAMRPDKDNPKKKAVQVLTIDARFNPGPGTELLTLVKD